MDQIFTQLSSAVSEADTLEQLTRPLLDILGTVTGYESTYLTTIDEERGLQHVAFARNVGEMSVPEGIDVPWSDTLCKRALEEGRLFTPDVEACWGDSEAAKAMGIKTYVSSPVRAKGGEVLGTLCAASAASHQPNPDAEVVLKLFSKVLAVFMEREQALQQLREANARLANMAMTDVLTGLRNRRAAMDDLSRMLAAAARDGSQVLVGLVDLDGFKAINDKMGHQVGDVFLQQVSDRMGRALRKTDVLARLGGDEFLLLGPMPADAKDAPRLLQERVFEATVGAYQLDGQAFEYAGASVGVMVADPAQVDAVTAIKLADEAMYRIKQARKAALACS